MNGPRSRVLIAGGGVAAVEAAIALRALAGERVDLTLLAPGRELAIAALAVGEAAGGPPAPSYDLAAIAADLDLRNVRDTLREVFPKVHRVTTDGGDELAYDALLLALGASAGRVLRGAVRFAGPPDTSAVGSAIDALDGLACPRIAFVATGGIGWTLPLYELALLVAARFDVDGRDREIVVVTPEGQPLALFGRTASREVSRVLSSRHIEVRTGAIAESVEEGRLWFAVEGSLPVDLAIALPEPTGPAVPGLPSDENGFVPVDRHGRVPGVEDIYAAGDMTSRPLKQGGLATQQADAAAESIAAWAGAPVNPQPYEPVLRGLLLTGSVPRFLRRSAGSTVPSTASERPLWMPAVKLVGRYLGPYLASHESFSIEPRTGALGCVEGASP